METTRKQKEAYLLSSVNHSLQILELLMVRDNLRLKEISGLLNLDQSSTYKMLYTLCYRGFACKDSHSRYHLGNKLAACRQLSESRHHIAEIANHYILNIYSKTKKTVVLGSLGMDERLLIVSIKEERNQASITGRTGASMNLHTTALGKVLLAFQEQEYLDTFLEHYELVKITGQTVTDSELFLEDLVKCREERWGVTFGENHEDHCDIAAPIFDYTGACVAALAIVCDRESMDLFLPLYLKYLQEATSSISGQLGYSPYQSDIWRQN